MSKGWIGVDLDGTLAHYEKWTHELHIGAPIPVMVERVKRWLSEGRLVKIFTARIHGCGPEVVDAVKQWCVEHLGQELEVTNVKDMHMIELWDDRAVQVEANTGRPIGKSSRGLV